MNTKTDLKQKVVMITGGASGIGRATALAFAEAGVSLVLCDIDTDDLNATLAELRETGVEILTLKVDVTVASEVEAAVATIIEEFGGIDVAVNNAGIGSIGEGLQETTEEFFDKVMAVNVKGVWNCMRHQIPAMLARGGGSIVNTASTTGLIGIPFGPAYVASKHGVLGLTKSVALEYATQGIRVNAVCPGVIETPMTGPTLQNEDVKQAALAWHPIGRLGQPSEVAEAIVWLASPHSSFVTGTGLSVDGGWTAG